MMNRHAQQRRAVVAPVFHELTRQLNRIPLDSRNPGDVPQVDGGHHVLQAVSKFVEQRFDFAESHQRRRVAGRRCTVANQMSDRHAMLVRGHTAADTVGHPSATAFVFWARVGIQVKRGDVLASFVRDFEKAYVFVPNRGFAIGSRHSDTKNSVAQIKHAVQHSLQRKVRTQFLVGEGILCFAKTFGPKRNVPMGQCAFVALFVGVLRQILQLRFAGLKTCGQQLVEHRLDLIGVFGHLVGETDRGVVGVAQQLAFFLTQL